VRTVGGQGSFICGRNGMLCAQMHMMYRPADRTDLLADTTDLCKGEHREGLERGPDRLRIIADPSTECGGALRRRSGVARSRNIRRGVIVLSVACVVTSVRDKCASSSTCVLIQPRGSRSFNRKSSLGSWAGSSTLLLLPRCGTQATLQVTQGDYLLG
jgi:hypothetical protein